ncbi:MAG: helix-turn-helix transcriptional regulator [Clostridiales bacterium]|nr:helix-turn-helix transcriptional regulator [Clostridiales bacterium]
MISKLSYYTKRIVDDCGYIRYSHNHRICNQKFKNSHLFVYVESGSWIAVINGEKYMLAAGDVVGFHDFVEGQGVEPISADAVAMYAYIQKAQDDSLIETAEPQEGFAMIKKIVNCTNFPRVKSTFEDMLYMFWADKRLKDVRMNTLAHTLITELDDACNAPDIPGIDAIDAVLRSFRLSSERFFSVDEAAEIAGLKPRAFSEKFKRITGESVYRYQINVKLDMAHQLLQSEPFRTMQEVADCFGFYDAFQFSKLFKQRFGQPPKELRRAARAQLADTDLGTDDDE